MAEVRESCGLCGVTGQGRAGVPLVAEGLLALQHRGQESAGILVSTDRGLLLHKRNGTVTEALGDVPLEWTSLPASAVMGHVRYGTYGGESVQNAQPLLVSMAGVQVGIAHNGTLSNAAALREELQGEGAIFQTLTDTEVVLHLMAREMGRSGSGVEGALQGALSRLRGAYCFLLLTDRGLYAVRDPYGFRPLALGRFPGGGWIVASETLAFNVCGAEYVREVRAGEVLFLGSGGCAVRSTRFGSDRELFGGREGLAQCIFEHVYFARPGSLVFGDSVYEVRVAMGRQLARELPVDCDLVAPVPDSGMFAALGYARELDLKFGMVFTRNHYIGRTFIDPASTDRSAKVMRKLQPIPRAVEGRRICIVEDSIVRGTTSRARIRLLREMGAREVHMRVSCPPHRYPCFFGIDFPERRELAAVRFTMDEISEQLGLDSLGYLSREGMLSCVGAHGPEDYCTACFDARYPVRPPDECVRELEESGEWSAAE